MGPDDFSVTVATVDERVGGVHQVEMLDADGGHHTFVSVIEELVPDERIVFTFKFDPEAEETKLTITFSDAEDGGTALRLEHERITMEGTLDTQSVNVGWGQTLAKLQALCENSFQHPSTTRFNKENNNESSDRNPPRVGRRPTLPARA